MLRETELTWGPSLAAWPLPYTGGELKLSFATFGGRGGGSSPARLAIYDLNGRLVRDVVSGNFAAGYQSATWDGRDRAGRNVASGVYFVRATSAGESEQLKLIVVR